MEENKKCHSPNTIKHSHGHGPMMWICLAMMVLGMMILPRFGGPFAIMAALICPLMHLLMMGHLFRRGKE